MGLVDLIEKLINEHGSAEIMEKRLVLFKEQAAAIDQRNSELQAEVIRLRRELDSVTSERDWLRSELAQFTCTGELDEIEKKFLESLARSEGIAVGRVALSLEIDPVRAEYYAQKLEGAEYIVGRHRYGGGSSLYYLAQKGREFLIKNHLI